MGSLKESIATAIMSGFISWFMDWMKDRISFELLRSIMMPLLMGIYFGLMWLFLNMRIKSAMKSLGQSKNDGVDVSATKDPNKELAEVKIENSRRMSVLIGTLERLIQSPQLTTEDRNNLLLKLHFVGMLNELSESVGPPS